MRNKRALTATRRVSSLGRSNLFVMAVVGCILLGAQPSAAQDPKLQAVSAPPALQPLPMPMHIGGRAVLKAGAATGSPSVVQTQWPGAYFVATFQGTEVFFRVGPNHEVLHVVVDSNAPLLQKAPEPGMYRVSALKAGAHTVKVLVATESQPAPNTFGGFYLPAQGTALPLPTPTRQIEFIGDSHTVGYGNTSLTSECTTDQVWATTDDTESFGPLTAAHLRADYQVNAISGRGVVRNYNNSPGDTLPRAYPYTLLNNKLEVYDDPSWKPQLLVIALGTNDFSTPLHEGEPWKTREDLHADFERTYVQFLEALHERNPEASILLWATNMADGEIESEVRKVEQQAEAQGIPRLDFLPFDHLAFTGCHGHPSLADDRAISDELIHWIDAHPDLWTRKDDPSPDAPPPPAATQP